MKKIGLVILLVTLGLGQENPDLGKCSAERAAARWLAASPNVMTTVQENEDARFYRINLTIDPASQTVDGTVLARFTALDSGLAQLDLDLADGLTVDTVTIADTAAVFSHSDGLLSIFFTPQDSGATIEATIHYSGSPDPNGFGSFIFSSRQGNDLIWSLSEPYGARDWWPCKDDPSDKPDSAETIITVPAGLVVASNGTLERVANGNDETDTYYWKEDYPIATYLISVAIYPYTVWEDTYTSLDSSVTMPLKFFSYPDHYDQLHANYLLTKDMIHAFAEAYGEYPFLNEKYGHAEFGWGGGMEHQTITSVGGWSQDLISHELSHQWWGDMITCADFHHIWLNEGFATYSQAIWWESQQGMSGYHNFMNTVRYYGAGTIYVEQPTTVGEIFSSDLSYHKASWVLHMLRHMVGDSTFFTILKTYGSDPRYKYGSATTEDFRDVAEAVSGMDLHAYFQEWIYGDYYPHYSVGYTVSNDTLHIELTQSSPGGQVFDMPLDFEIRTNQSTYTEVVHNNTATAEYDFPLPQGSTFESVTLDPNQWVLRTVSYHSMNTGDEPLPHQWNLEAAYPNPFNARILIPYTIGADTETDFSIYDLAGHAVFTRTKSEQAGKHNFNWDGKDSFGRSLPSGVYLIRFRAGSFSKTAKVVYLK